MAKVYRYGDKVFIGQKGSDGKRRDSVGSAKSGESGKLYPLRQKREK